MGFHKEINLSISWAYQLKKSHYDENYKKKHILRYLARKVASEMKDKMQDGNMWTISIFHDNYWRTNMDFYILYN